MSRSRFLPDQANILLLLNWLNIQKTERIHVERDRQAGRQTGLMACSSGSYRFNPLSLPAAAVSHLYKIYIWSLTGWSFCTLCCFSENVPSSQTFVCLTGSHWVSLSVAPFTLAFACGFSAPISHLSQCESLGGGEGVKFCSGPDPPLEVVSWPYYWRTEPVWTEKPALRTKGVSIGPSLTTQVLHST